MHKAENQNFNHLIEENYRLVWSVVNRFSYIKDDKEDLFQTGCIGLIMAAKKFDETRGFAFSTFAMPYILGEIRNYLREKNHLKISKQTYKVSKDIKQILSTNSKISIKQLAKQMNLGYEEVLMGYNLSNNSSVMSLDKEIDTNFTLSDVVLSDDRFSVRHEKILLDEVYEQLSEIEKRVFYLRFHYGLTQSEVAKKLKVSQSKISRLEKQITKNLYNYYKIS
jgi:RNA polymerase sporulation-specific sigma factor